MTILVVDDEAESLAMLRELLTAEGIEVRATDGGELALAAMHVEKPDLILIDIRMPGIDGFEVCRRVKRNPDAQDIPVIFLSASGEPREKVEGFRIGAVDFVTKPFHREELLARVRTHLELRRLRLHLERQVEERTAELRESEQRFRTMANAAPVMIWASDRDKRCIFFNKGWLDFTGRSLNEELGNGWVENVHPDDVTRILETYSSAFDARRSFQMEYRLRRADGEYCWVLDNGVPRRGPNGVFSGYIGSCIDITDLKRAQQADLERQKLESIGLLAAGIAHDFNNLLGGIIAETDVALAERDAGMSLSEELRKIRAQALCASEIVRQLMVYTGSDTAEFGLEFGLIDITAIVEGIVDLIKISISKHIVLKTDLHKQLPPVAGHAAQIRQVLMNLIINSSEAIGARAGVITVRTSPVSGRDDSASGKSMEMAGSDCVALEVSDTGSGMTEEQRRKIFDPFFTTKSVGRGLGLAVVHGIVRAHGGSINVLSAPRQGTRFRILLPCARQTVQEKAFAPSEGRNEA
jgi:PAS domain S-box-containing protein